MKLVKCIGLSGLLLVLAFISCEEEENNIAEVDSSWTLSQAELKYPQDNFEFKLDRTNKEDVIRFEWEKPASERSYTITYNWMLDLVDGDFSSPLLKILSAENGGGRYAEVSYLQIDEALANAGVKENETVAVKWAVQAVSTSKTSLSAYSMNLQRFDVPPPPSELFISGSATEGGANLADALAMKKIHKADGSKTNTFQIYTKLEAGNSYNFYSAKDGSATVYTIVQGTEGDQIEIGDNAVSVSETAVYRVTVNFSSEQVEIFKIDRWSVVGNVIKDGWGGDETLFYKGNGVFQSSIELIDADPADANKRFIFRANGDWGQVLKLIPGTENQLTLEGTKDELGYETIDDIPVNDLGKFVVTLNLNAEGYTYSIEEDTNTGGGDDTLFLLANGSSLGEFTKNGDVFTYEFFDLDPATSYSINTKDDGSGTSYSFSGVIGETRDESDKVTGEGSFSESTEALAIAKKQAYRITMDMTTKNLRWEYYNFKLFHWDIWDNRSEIIMNYIGNYTWEITSDLTAGHNSKFITPWDFQFGGETAEGLTGNLVQGDAGMDLNNLSESGSYKASMKLSTDFSTGTYIFEKQ